MRYKINNKAGKTIAWFEVSYDRDVCFDLLNEDCGELKKEG